MTHINIKTWNINNIDSLVFIINYIKANKLQIKSPEVTKDELLLFSKTTESNRYHPFYIPKKRAGQFRQIFAPCERLKEILRAINLLLSLKYHPSLYVTGFAHNTSVITNASIHVHQKYVYNIDIHDFFGSIHSEQIVKRLMDTPYCYPYIVATTIANLTTTHTNENIISLAQGSPLSPILSNIVCESMDKELYQLSLEYGINYSRYADDITFSGETNIYKIQGAFYKKLNCILSSYNFRLNLDKTRILNHHFRQEVTGLIVNEKTNVRKSYIKDIRNLLYIWQKYGYRDAYLRFYSKHTKFNASKKYIPNFVSYLRGKLNYLSQVRGKDDSIYLRYKSLFDRLRNSPRNNFIGKTLTIEKFERLYGKLQVVTQNHQSTTSYKTFLSCDDRREIIISPRLHIILQSNSTTHNIQDILRNCVIHQIFDKNGVKWLLSLKNEVYNTKHNQTYMHPKVDANTPSFIVRNKKDDNIALNEYPLLVVGESIFDGDYGFMSTYHFYYCSSFEMAKKAILAYFKDFAKVTVKDIDTISASTLYSGITYSKYDDYSYSCHIEKR